VESRWHYVSQLTFFDFTLAGLRLPTETEGQLRGEGEAKRSRTAGKDTRTQKLTRLLRHHSYNRYLAVAARVVRRSLKEEKRIAAERRGQQELRFAKWSVSAVWKTEEKDWMNGGH
jgi:hypothetical protein